MHNLLKLICCIVLISVGCTRSAPSASVWQSPDGLIAVHLHGGWEHGPLDSAKQYSAKTAKAIIPGSQYRLLLGGLLQKRYINFSVVTLPNPSGLSVEQALEGTSRKLMEQGSEVVRKSYDGRFKGYMQYRYLHSGDDVSAVIVYVGIPTSLYIFEIVGPRKDEERLRGEALQIFSSIVLQQKEATTLSPEAEIPTSLREQPASTRATDLPWPFPLD